jgi:sec-independent protein translocase protein TatB
MFFDIGWSEFLVIGAVALIVIGPKDLPAALRVAGFWVRKARSLSREFHSSVEQMMREAELHEVQNELRKATEFDLNHEFNKIVDPVTDPAIKAPATVPDYVDTTPASAVPIPEEPAPAPPFEEEPQLPLPMPPAHATSAAEPEPEPVRAAEPSKP